MNREFLMLSGVKEYTNISSRDILFGRSFGCRIGGGTPWYTPNKFELVEATVFGAAYYNGTWKGVRIIKEKN